jgi:hypothetical protein
MDIYVMNGSTPKYDFYALPKYLHLLDNVKKYQIVWTIQLIDDRL